MVATCNIGHISPCSYCSCKSLGWSLPGTKRSSHAQEGRSAWFGDNDPWAWSFRKDDEAIITVIDSSWWFYLEHFSKSSIFPYISGASFSQGFWRPWSGAPNYWPSWLLDDPTFHPGLRRPGDGRASLPVVLTDGLTEMEQVMFLGASWSAKKGWKSSCSCCFVGLWWSSIFISCCCLGLWWSSIFLFSLLAPSSSSCPAGVGNETSRDGIHRKDGPRETLPAGGQESVTIWLSVMKSLVVLTFLQQLHENLQAELWGLKWRTPPGLCPDRNLGRGRKDDFGRGRLNVIFLGVGKFVG